MKNILKTALLTAALLATTGLASADPDITVTQDFLVSPYSNLEPGYAEAIDKSTLPALDSTVAMYDEFEDPTLFMSDAGVYRYAYYEKTGVWLDRAEAESALTGYEDFKIAQ